jgi:hypothetical protein
MEKKWLVRAAILAAVGSLTWSNQAEAQAQTPPTKQAEDEGPFAPKGKTGKLREAEQAENAPKPEPEAPPPKEKPYSVGADIVYGLGRTGSGTEVGADPIEYKVASIIVGATYQADPRVGVRFRIPVSNGSVDTGQTYSATALGNIELGMTYTSDMGPHTKLPFDVGLYLPVAQGDRFPPPEDPARLRTFRVNTMAQWARGLEEDALFAPHRLSLVPRLSLRYAEGGIAAGGFVKLPLMLRIGGQDVPVPSSEEGGSDYALKSVVFEAVVGGDFRVDIQRNKFDIGTRAWITWMSSEFVQRILANTTAPDRLQINVEPQLRAMFGQLKATAGVIIPIAGRLSGGDLQHAVGFRLAAAYGF